VWLQTPCTTRNREPGQGLTSEDWLQQRSACSALGIVVSSDLQQLAVLGWPATGTTATVDTTPNRGGSPGPGQYNRNKGPSWRSRLSGTDKVLDHMLRAGLVLLRYLVSVPSHLICPSGCASRTNALDKSWSQERTDSAVSDHLAAWFFSASLHLFRAHRKTRLDQASNSKPQTNDVDICRSRRASGLRGRGRFRTLITSPVVGRRKV
jgi:hypothetical protein